MSEHLETLRCIVEQYREDEEAEQEWAQGSLKQRDRLEAVADWCAATWGGDLIEIGCFNGSTTLRLARVARKHGRRVVGVDPWIVGVQECRGGEYENFLRITGKYKDIIDVIRERSQEKHVIRQIQQREICFAFVDGLHTYKACLSDIEAVAHCQGVIAVDDLNWREDLPRAFEVGAKRINREAYRPAFCREGYLLPC